MESKNWVFVKVFQDAIDRAKKLQQGAVMRRVCKHHFEVDGLFAHTKKWRCKKCGFCKPYA